MATIAPTKECGNGEHTVQIRIFTDDFPSETYWWLTGPDVFLNDGGFEQPETAYEASGCLPTGESYSFVIWDGHGDGMCCQYGQGSYQILIDGLEVASGGEFGNFEVKSIRPGCPDGKRQVKVTVTTDFYGSETLWRLTSRNREVLLQGNGYGSWETHQEQICVSDVDCLSFLITDTFGDGFCCMHGYGRYSIEYDGRTILESAFQDGYSESHRFGGGCPQIAMLEPEQSDGTDGLDANIGTTRSDPSSLLSSHNRAHSNERKKRSAEEEREFEVAQAFVLDKSRPPKPPPKHIALPNNER